MTNVWRVSDVIADEPAFERDRDAYQSPKDTRPVVLVVMLWLAVWAAVIAAAHWGILPVHRPWVDRALRAFIGISAGFHFWKFLKIWLLSFKEGGQHLNFSDSLDLTTIRIGGFTALSFFAVMFCLLGYEFFSD
jgi:hypothetical protein